MMRFARRVLISGIGSFGSVFGRGFIQVMGSKNYHEVITLRYDGWHREALTIKPIRRDNRTRDLRREMLVLERSTWHTLNQRVERLCTRFSVWRAPFGKPRGASL